MPLVALVNVTTVLTDCVILLVTSFHIPVVEFCPIKVSNLPSAVMNVLILASMSTYVLHVKSVLPIANFVMKLVLFGNDIELS